MLKCLVDSVMDHPHVKSMIDHRVDHVSELKQRWAQQQKEFKDTEKQMLVDKMAREANQLAAAGEADDEADSRPMLEIPDELLNELPGEKENQERLKKIDGIQSAHERLLSQWEKKKQTRDREEERIEEKLQQDEKRSLLFVHTRPFSVSLSLSLCPSVSLSLSISVFIYFCVYVSVPVSVSVSVCP